MPEPTLPVRRRRLAASGFLLFVMACADGGGGGCDGGGGCGDTGCGLGESVPYPANGEVVEQSGQIRLTPEGLGFLEENAGPLVSNILGDEGLTFCIPPTDQSGFLICQAPAFNNCDQGDVQAPGCLFDAEIGRLELTPTAATDGGPDSLEVTVFLTEVNERLPIEGPILGECHELIVNPDELPVFLTIKFHVEGPNERIRLEITDIGLDFGSLGLTHDDDGEDDILGPVRCSGWVFAIETLGPLLAGFLTDPITQQVEQQLCVACETGCPDGAACGGDPEVCRWQDTGECVPIPLGLEGAIDLGASLADFGGQEAILNFLVYLANFADAENDGMTLGMQMGFTSEHNECVPRQDAPDIGRVPKSGELISDITPAGSSFMLGVGVSEKALNLAMWAVYNSGALCLALSSSDIDQLTSASLSILLSSLSDLTEDQNVPVVLRIRPTQAPTVLLGSGEVASGNPPEILDPLITLQIERMQIDFMSYVEERFVRLFTLDTDMDIPLALTPSDDGSGIQILLGDLEEAFVRIDAVDAELLAAEDVDRLADVLPGLIGAFAPELTGALADPIALPEFGGYRLALTQDSFTSIEDNTMMAIFADLEPVEDGGMATVELVSQAYAEVQAVFGPSAEDIDAHDAALRRGDLVDLDRLRSEVVLAVRTEPADRLEREYSYRIDAGPWHLYRPEGALNLTDPEFLIEGRHTIEVRSRVPGQRNSMSLVSPPVEVLVDLQNPSVTLRRLDDHRIEVDARDSVWGEHELAMRYRFDGGPWEAQSNVTSLVLPDSGRNTVEVEVEVNDPAGRSRLVRRTFAIHGRGEAPSNGGGGCNNCAVGGGSVPPPPWLALGLVALFWRRRSRRAGRGAASSPLPLVLVALGLALGASLLVGCGDEPKSSNGGGEDAGDGGSGCEEVGCPDDQTCVENICVNDSCASDDECPETMACVDEDCVIRTRCEDEGDCPAGQFCIDDDEDGGSECLSVPCEGQADCGVVTCGAGNIALCMDNSCVCEIPCAEGCGAGQFCCNPQNRCRNLPDECEPLECDPGFGPGIVTDASGDPDSCDITDPVCDCLELPPLPIGDVGSYLSAAAGPDGTIYVAAFNRTYEDLMVGIVGDDGSIDWRFVDGLPDSGEVVGSLNGPRGGIAEGGPRVGRYTSIAVASDGDIHIAYFNRSTRTLSYAHGDAGGAEIVWTFDTIDETERSGLYTSITLSSDDVPGVAYFVQRAEVEASRWDAQVRYAWADEATPKSWTIELVDSQELAAPCGGDCGGSTRCNTLSNRCEVVLRESACGGCGVGEQCFEQAEGDPVCGAVAPNSSLIFLDEGAGLFAASDRFADNDVAVVYYDHTNGQLRYAASEAGTFAASVPAVLDGDPTRDVGWYPAVTVDASDGVHITYVDAQNDDLLYMNLAVGTPEVIDAGIRGIAAASEPVLVGDDSSLIVLEDGTLQVAYMDSFRHDALVARRSSEGVWLAPATIMGDESPYVGAFGFYLNQLHLGGETVLLSYRINTREATRDVVVRSVE